MLTLAFLIGIYSYCIFFIGLSGFLYTTILIPFTIFYIVLNAYLMKSHIVRNISFKFNKIFYFLFILLILQGIVNLIGALGPELGFDALWYHLTLPKLYLINHQIYHIPFSLFYYSDMPKLIEMIYIGALSFGSEIVVKILHFSFGILCCITLYKLARKFVSPFLSLLCVAVFYANLVVGWESITAYIDLGRTFFEITALFAFITWIESKKEKYLYITAILTGFAITAKVLAIGTLLTFLASLIVFELINKKSIKKIISDSITYLFLSLIVPLPWCIFSFIHTGNPVYPFFSSLYPTTFSLSLLNPITFFTDIWNIFMKSADPISPIYMIMIPVVAILFRKYSLKEKLFVLYTLFATICWYITPRTGGGRFILPYLPAFSLVVVFSLKYLDSFKKNVIILLVFILLIISIGFRFLANSRYIPVILRQETKAQFLQKNLNFSFGDFYDVDGFFSKNIKPKDKVLLIGFHNLYYVNFPFTLSATEKEITYVAIQNTDTPLQYTTWKKVYENIITKVTVYKNPQ